MRDFAGPRAKIMAVSWINLQTNLRLKEWKHFQGAATENQVYKVISTENFRSIASNVMTTATGLTTKSLIRQNVRCGRAIDGVRGARITICSLISTWNTHASSTAKSWLKTVRYQVCHIHEAIISGESPSNPKFPCRSGQALAPEALKESLCNNGDTQSLLILTATVVEPGTEPPGR